MLHTLLELINVGAIGWYVGHTAGVNTVGVVGWHVGHTAGTDQCHPNDSQRVALLQHVGENDVTICQGSLSASTSQFMYLS